MQHIQDKFQLKAGCLRNVTISGHIFKNIPVYKRFGKFIRSLFKEYQYSLPEEEVLIGYATFQDIVKLLTMHSESKAGFSTYNIKLCHGNNVLIICLIG